MARGARPLRPWRAGRKPLAHPGGLKLSSAAAAWRNKARARKWCCTAEGSLPGTGLGWACGRVIHDGAQPVADNPYWCAHRIKLRSAGGWLCGQARCGRHPQAPAAVATARRSEPGFDAIERMAPCEGQRNRAAAHERSLRVPRCGAAAVKVGATRHEFVVKRPRCGQRTVPVRHSPGIAALTSDDCAACAAALRQGRSLRSWSLRVNN